MTGLLMQEADANPPLTNFHGEVDKGRGPRSNTSGQPCEKIYFILESEWKLLPVPPDFKK